MEVLFFILLFPGLFRCFLSISIVSIFTFLVFFLRCLFIIYFSSLKIKAFVCVLVLSVEGTVEMFIFTVNWTRDSPHRRSFNQNI